MNRALGMAIFLLFASTILGAIHVYLWLRLIRDPGLTAPLRQIGSLTLLLLYLSIPLSMFASRWVPFGVSRALTFLPYVWLGMMMMLFFWFITADGIKILLAVLNKLRGGDLAVVDETRRLALGQLLAGGAAITVGGLTTLSVINATRSTGVKKVRIELKAFPPAMDGFLVVQLSDLHLGITFGEKWLARVVQQVNQLRPDLIAITGDLMDGSVERLAREVAPLADLRATHGVFFVTGNHEYYSGVEPWMPKIESLGIKVLRNERVEIAQGEERFYLAGIDDHNATGMAPGHGPDLKLALRGRDPRQEVILLAHQPRAVFEAAEMEVGLVLSGHTHGGQIWPFTYLVGLQQPYNKGLYRHSPRTQIYVNQGTGLWGPPMRLGTRSEITALSLYHDQGGSEDQLQFLGQR